MRRYGANETDAGFTDRIITDLFLCRKVKKTKQKQSLRKYTERGHNKDQMQEMYIDADNI